MSKDSDWLLEIEKDFDHLESYLNYLVEGGSDPVLYGYRSFFIYEIKKY